MKADYFNTLLHRYNWKPLPGCPGRYILRGGISHLEPEEIVGEAGKISIEDFPSVPDPVYYSFFTGGGLISYKKAEGFIHTLCDLEGMARKMGKLRESIDLSS